MAELSIWDASEHPDTIIHTTQTDFTDRDTFGTPVHLVQGDDRLPVVEVELYKGGLPYALPEGAAGNIRWRKPVPSPYYVWNPLLGLSSDRMKVYFEVTEQMTYQYGRVPALIEIELAGRVGMSGPLPIFLDKNPVQPGDIEDENELKTFAQYTQEAKESKEAAAESEKNAKKSEENAAESEKNAKKSEENAAKSAEVTTHPPTLKDGSDHWWVWDWELGDYKESDVDAGVSVNVSPETITGEPGTSAMVENVGTPTDAVLRFTIPRGEPGILPKPNVEMRRMIYRGKNLGDSYSEEQQKMVSDGTFDDIYIGDYWFIDGKRWIVCDINLFLPVMTEPSNHLVIMPDKELFASAWSSGNVGYVGSTIRARLQGAEGRGYVERLFGASNLKSVSVPLVNAVSNGGPSGYIFVDSTIELPSEIELFGTINAQSTNSAGSNTSPTFMGYGYRYDIPFAISILNPMIFREFTKTTTNHLYYLRDIVANIQAATVQNSYMSWIHWDTVGGCIPYFILGAS